MLYPSVRLQDGTLLTSELQDLYHQAAVQAHVYGCLKQHGRPYSGYAEVKNMLLRYCERELSWELSIRVVTALSQFERLAEEHPEGSALCTMSPIRLMTTDPDFARSGFNADLAQLLS